MINADDETSLAYLLDPSFQLVNTAGKPLTDGYICVYIHGTRTKYYCYQDWDKQYLHPFKIPLDSLGANIVLASPAHAYDVYVYNKYGSLIMSRYNVVPATGDAEVVTDVTTITSNDGTVQVASSDQTNWDLSIADTIAPVTAEVDEHDRQLTQIEHDISDINGTLADKKDKQDPYVAEGGVTKTITRVEQDRNGNLNVTYSDIDLPPEVPTVEITSPNGTIQVASSIDVETNTKTFEIDVKNGDPVWHYWTGNNAWTVINSAAWKQINRPAIGAGTPPHQWNPDIKRGIYDAKAHFTVTFHNADYSKTVPNQIIQVGFRAKFVGKNDPTAIRYEDLGAWTYDPTYYTTEPYQYNFAQESLRQNHDTSKILNVANYWGDTEFNVYFEAALLNTDGGVSTPQSIDNVLYAEITYFGYHEVKGAVQAAGGGGREYSEGSGIDITNDAISVKAGEGLSFVENRLTVDFDEVNEHQVQSDWNQTASAEPDFIKNKPVEKQLVEGRNIHITDTGTAIEISSDSDPQVQSDWDVNDADSPAYIQHKPDLEVFVTHDELATAIDVVNNNIATAVDVVETHLSSAVDIIEQQISEIPSQVQSDWTENDSADPAYIQHKPAEKTLKAGSHITITDVGTAVEIASEGEPQVQSDWEVNDSSSPAYIQHKPNLDGFATKTELGSAVDIIEQQIQNIPAQVQSDWTEADSDDPAFIKNKPSEKNLVAGAGVTISETNDDVIVETTEIASGAQLVAGSGIDIQEVNGQVVISSTGGSFTQVQSNWNESDTTSPAFIQNKPDLTTYATKTELGTVEASIPANTSDLNNDSGFITSSDLTNLASKTDLGSAVDVLEQQISNIPAQVQSDWNESDTTDPAYIENKPTTTPLIAGQSVTITDVGSGIEIDVDTSTLATKTELASAIDIVEADIPTHTSDLQNDSGFITSSAIPDLEDLNTAGITDIQVVAALPASPVSTVLYLVRE